jgi:hypothetical protein
MHPQFESIMFVDEKKTAVQHYRTCGCADKDKDKSGLIGFFLGF